MTWCVAMKRSVQRGNGRWMRMWGCVVTYPGPESFMAWTFDPAGATRFHDRADAVSRAEQANAVNGRGFARVVQAP